MDAKNILNELSVITAVSTLCGFRRLFFSQKANEIKRGARNNWSYMSEKYAHNKSLQDTHVASLRAVFPEAEFVSDESADCYWVKMENTDFVIPKCFPLGFSFFDNDITNPDYEIYDDAAILMREFDSAMPAWETEFRAFCTENQEYIDKIEKLRLSEELRINNNYSIAKGYLRGKICDYACMHRKLMPYMSDAVLNSLANSGMRCNGTKCSMTNTTIDIISHQDIDRFGRFCSEVSFDLSAYGTKCSIGLYSAEVLLEIDRLIPQWADDAKKMAIEIQKQKKIEEISKNTTKVLIKNKLHTTGYKYQIFEKEKKYTTVKESLKFPKELILEVKLQRNRKIEVNIPFNSFDKANNILDALPAHIDSINSVPMKYRIKNQMVRGENWES